MASSYVGKLGRLIISSTKPSPDTRNKFGAEFGFAVFAVFVDADQISLEYEGHHILSNRHSSRN